MARQIRHEPAPSEPALRDLIVASLDSLAGPATLLDAELPCAGRPVLALDAARRLTLISFDPEDGIEALLSGLTAWDELRAAGPWLQKLYPMTAGELGAPLLPPQLIVLTPTPLPGTNLITAGESGLKILRFRVLSVDGQAALLVEPPVQPSAALSAGGPPLTQNRTTPTADLDLTAEEAAFLASAYP